MLLNLATAILSLLSGIHCFVSSHRRLMQTSQVDVLKCDDWAEIADGQDVYLNNVWGKYKLNPNLSYRQCLVQDKTTKDYGWYWNWQGCNDSVYAFPQCFKGLKPWNNGTEASSPVTGQLKSFKQLKATIAADTYQSTGTFNFILEAWALNKPRTGATPNPADISHEILWFLHSNGEAKPAGSVVGTFTMDNVMWDVYYIASGWHFYTFFPKTKSVCIVRNGVLKCNKTISVLAYFKYLQGRGFVSGNEWTHGLEVGNEVMGGCINGNTAAVGTTLMRKFDVTVRK